eukprot:4656625-Amphidinium_carterae.1
MLSASSPAPLHSTSMTPSPLSVPAAHQQSQLPGGSPLQTPGQGMCQVPVTPASGSGDPWWARAATLPSVLGPSASAVPPGLGCSHVSSPSVGCNMASASVSPMPMYPQGYQGPPPSVPPTAHPSHGGTPHGASPADDFGGRVKATPAKLPRLEIKATDASKITLQIQNW